LSYGGGYGSGYPTMSPGLVGMDVAYSLYVYLRRIGELGVITGQLGQQDVNPRLRPIVDALHAVLSGGDATVDIRHPGSPDIVRELNEMLAAGTREGNEINRLEGYYVTISP
jgi:hypothetical protein